MLFKLVSHFPVDGANCVYGDVNIWPSGTYPLECGMNRGSPYLCEIHAALIDPGAFLPFLAEGEAWEGGEWDLRWWGMIEKFWILSRDFHLFIQPLIRDQPLKWITREGKKIISISFYCSLKL